MSEPAKSALVTGGANGLGAAITGWLVAHGWHVTVIDRRSEPASGAGLRSIGCDLASREQVDRTLPAILAAGPFDLVVLNAGISATGRFEEMPSDAIERVLHVNAEAPMVLASSLLSDRAISGGGALVFVSSLSHFTGYPGAAAYAASKDALAVFARSIRKTAAGRGVTVTVAYPGPLRTDHAERHAPQGADAAKRMDPLEAARDIIGAALKGRRSAIPGIGNRFFAVSGRLFPRIVTAQMRRLIYERLGEGRW